MDQQWSAFTSIRLQSPLIGCMTLQSGLPRMSFTLLVFFNSLLEGIVSHKAIYRCTDLTFVGVCVLCSNFLLVNLSLEQCILKISSWRYQCPLLRQSIDVIVMQHHLLLQCLSMKSKKINYELCIQKFSDGLLQCGTIRPIYDTTFNNVLCIAVAIEFKTAKQTFHFSQEAVFIQSIYQLLNHRILVIS